MSAALLKPAYGVTGFSFEAVQRLRRSGRPLPQGGSADYQARYDLDLLRAESQRMDRDNAIYAAIVNRALDNIIGDGFSLQSRAASARKRQKIEALWRDWCESGPEVRGFSKWWQDERLVLRHVWVEGDVGAILVSQGDVAGRYQLVEAGQIVTPGAGAKSKNIENGVELDKYGRPLRFHVADYSDSGATTKRVTQPIEAKDFVFVCQRLRASQTRGFPVQTPNLPVFHMLSDVLVNEAYSWQLQSRIAVAITRPGAAELAMAASDESDRTKPPAVADRMLDFDDGLVFHLEPGESVQTIQRNIPGHQFTDSVTTYLRILGLPVGMPLELVLLDWSKTNYSSARAALEQAFGAFRTWQRILEQQWHDRLFAWKVSEWVQTKQISGDDVYDHVWIKPAFPWLDQLKEGQAWGQRIDRGLTTHAEAIKSQNRDREDVVGEREREVRDAIAIAQRIEDDTTVKVPWQIFAGLGQPAAQVETAAMKEGQMKDGPMMDEDHPQRVEDDGNDDD